MLSNIQLFLLAFLLSFFNWLMTFLGSSLVYFVKSKSQKLISSALGLAAGIMIAATFFSLLLPAINQVQDHFFLLFLIPIIFFIGGLFLRLCDKFLPHEHIISHQKEGPQNKLSKNKLLLLAMTLHNIPEGLSSRYCHWQVLKVIYYLHLFYLLELVFKIFLKEQQFLYLYMKVAYLVLKP